MSRLLELGDRFGEYAGVMPGLLVALVLAAMLCMLVARRLRVGRIQAFLLLAALGAILAVTVTPSREAVLFGMVGSGTCDLSRIGLAPLSTYATISDASLNIALFFPLGFLVGILPRSPWRPLVIAAAVVLPVFIETTQLIATPLGRGCESADVFDNLSGLFLGLGAGWVAPRVWRRLRDWQPRR